jgi:hypothetical protein
VAEAQRDSRIVAVHAAMAGGTGLYRFEKHFPERCYDVGIAEQHAVTFAAGLACEGLVPFCTIYSTFLQRGYDQVVHDVSLQKLPGEQLWGPRRRTHTHTAARASGLVLFYLVWRGRLADWLGRRHCPAALPARPPAAR